MLESNTTRFPSSLMDARRETFRLLLSGGATPAPPISVLPVAPFATEMLVVVPADRSLRYTCARPLMQPAVMFAALGAVVL